MAKSASVVEGPSDTMRCASPAGAVPWLFSHAPHAPHALIASAATHADPHLIDR
jgi:hypothetical protein